MDLVDLDADWKHSTGSVQIMNPSGENTWYAR